MSGTSQIEGSTNPMVDHHFQDYTGQFLRFQILRRHTHLTYLLQDTARSTGFRGGGCLPIIYHLKAA